MSKESFHSRSLSEETRSPFLSDEERELLQKSCDEAGIPRDIVERMIVQENQVYGMGRRHGIWESLELLVNEGIEREQKRSTNDLDQN